MIPVAVEISSAGICDTSPSPTVSREYVDIASPALIPFCIIPIAIPPIRLIETMIKPAIASPFTNLEAPSIAP